MRSRRLASLAVLAGIAGAAPDGLAGDAAPSSDALTVAVATNTVLRADPASVKKEAGSRVVVPPLLVELQSGAPEGLVVEKDASAWHGWLERDGVQVAIGAVCPGTDRTLLYVDADRDQRFDEVRERYSAPIKPLTSGPAGTEARYEDVGLGAAKCGVRVVRRIAGLSGTLSGRGGAQVALAFSDAKPDALEKAPRLPGRVRYASATVEDRTVYVVAARGEGDVMSVVAGERSELGALTPEELRSTPVKRSGRTVGSRWTAALPGGGVATLVETTDNVVAELEPRVRRGTAEVEGVDWVLHLVDVDLDGAFVGAADRWWFGDDATWATGPGGRGAPNASSMTEGDAPQLLEGGLLWTLSSVDEGKATLVRSRDPEAAEPVLRRRADRVNGKRWFPRFVDEAAAFGPANGIDPSRPRAERTFDFRFALTLDDARALAKKEGKPLLVDFEADWCVWCKRLDFYTYVDREVSERLSKFTAVKVNNELDPKRSFRALGWDGIPAVAVFGPDGKPLRFHVTTKGRTTASEVDHSAWLEPKAFVAALDSALAAHAAATKSASPATPPAPTPGAPGKGAPSK